MPYLKDEGTKALVDAIKYIAETNVWNPPKTGDIESTPKVEIRTGPKGGKGDTDPIGLQGPQGDSNLEWKTALKAPLRESLDEEMVFDSSITIKDLVIKFSHSQNSGSTIISYNGSFIIPNFTIKSSQYSNNYFFYNGYYDIQLKIVGNQITAPKCIANGTSITTNDYTIEVLYR